MYPACNHRFPGPLAPSDRGRGLAKTVTAWPAKIGLSVHRDVPWWFKQVNRHTCNTGHHTHRRPIPRSHAHPCQCRELSAVSKRKEKTNPPGAVDSGGYGERWKECEACPRNFRLGISPPKVPTPAEVG